MKNMPGMSGMKMPGMKMGGTGDPTREPAGADTTDRGRGMDTPAPPEQAAGKTVMRESMTNMPLLQPKRIWTVTGTEDWAMLRGFGEATGMVNMMNGMMVGGSAMQHMKMGKMDMKMAEMPAPTPEEARTEAAPATESPATESPAASGLTVAAALTGGTAVVGDNTVALTIKDAAGKPVSGLKLAASVAMVTMDMGTAHPSVREMGDGQYRTTANFSMAGPWRVVVSGDGGKVRGSFDFQAGSTQSTQSAPAEAPAEASAPPASTPAAGPVVVTAALSAPARVGSANTLTVTVMGADGKPLTGAKVSSSVAMTSMDMGTTHPSFKDLGGGKYAGQVGFSMAGSWRVTIKAVPPGGKPQTKSFDFTAK